jgi:hypothetical protein
MCDAVIDLGRQGKFREEWALELGVTPRTLHTWAKMHPEFQEALELARINSAAYWSEQLRLAAMNPKVPWRPLVALVAKRFPEYWGPRAPDLWQELGLGDLIDESPRTSGRDPNMTPEEVQARLETLRLRQDILNEEARLRWEPT